MGFVSEESSRLGELMGQGQADEVTTLAPLVFKVSWEWMSAAEALGYAQWRWTGEAGVFERDGEGEGEIRFEEASFTMERYLIATYIRASIYANLDSAFEAFPYTTNFPVKTLKDYRKAPLLTYAPWTERNSERSDDRRREDHKDLRKQVAELVERLDTLESRVTGPIYETLVGLDRELKSLANNMGRQSKPSHPPVYPNPQTDEIRRLQKVYETHLRLAAGYEGWNDREMAGIEMAKARKVESELRRLGA